MAKTFGLSVLICIWKSKQEWVCHFQK